MNNCSTVIAGMVLCCALAAASASPRNLAPVLSWTAQPTFLVNPADTAGAEVSGDGVVFRVSQPGRGMKWTATPPEPIDLARTPWVLMRYRAVEAGPQVDYFLYLGGENTRTFQNLALAADLIADGAWRTLVLRAQSFKATWLAVQLQAAGAGAKLEIGRLEFLEQRPKLAAEEAAAVGERRPDRFESVDISAIFNTGADALVKSMNLAGWFATDEVVVSGVPFTLAKGERVASTRQDEASEIRVPLPDTTTREVFMLMAAVSPTGRTQVVTEPHQFSARLGYAKGQPDECVPARVGSGYGLAPGFAVYAIAADATRTLKEIVVRENVKGTVLNLAAVTLGRFSDLAPHARPAPAHQPEPYKPLPAPTLWKGAEPWIGTLPGGPKDVVHCHGFAFDLRDGVSLNAMGGTIRPTVVCNGSLWTVRVDGRELKSTDFRGEWRQETDASGTVRLRDRLGLGLSGSLEMRALPDCGLQMKLHLRSAETRRMRVVFPAVPPVRSIGGAAHTSYCFPRRGAAIGDAPCDMREAYSGSFPLQFMDAYGGGGGLYLMTQDLDDVYRYFLLKKDAEGVSMGVEYLEQEVGPSKPLESVKTVLGFHSGDWHAALDAYRDWVKTWYKPDAPRKDWFRRVFNFRQQFLRFYIPGGERYYDKTTRSYSFDEGISADAAAFGGVDYLHLFDWGAMEKQGRTGDYEPWDEIGGLDRFRTAIKTTQAAGTPVGLYIEGYLVEPASKIGQAHGREWEIIGGDGKGLPFFAPAMNMCSSVTAWQDYLAGVYSRVSRQTGAMGYYCDQMGFADPGHFCYSPNHGHAVPEPPLRGQRDLIKKVRRAVGPEAALYTEETPVDGNTRHQDGSFTYAISQAVDALSPSHVNLTRFALPDFKTFEIIICDQPLGDRLTAARQVFFNGEGIWLEGPADTWFAPEVRDFIGRMHRVMRNYEDCFTSLSPVPLVPTGQPMVFANQFPGNGRILWTLFNANWSTVRGRLLAVAHKPDTRYIDAFSHREIEPKIEKGTAYLDLELDPRDVGCVVAE